MFKFLLRVFGVCGFFVLGLASVQAQAQAQAPIVTFFGVTLNAPLSVPKCQGVVEEYLPISACYVIEREENEGEDRWLAVKVYYPKNQAPEGAHRNRVDVVLHNDKVIMFSFFANSISAQEAFLQSVVKQLGSPIEYEGEDLPEGDVKGVWIVDDFAAMLVFNEDGLVIFVTLDV